MSAQRWRRSGGYSPSPIIRGRVTYPSWGILLLQYSVNAVNGLFGPPRCASLDPTYLTRSLLTGDQANGTSPKGPDQVVQKLGVSPSPSTRQRGSKSPINRGSRGRVLSC